MKRVSIFRGITRSYTPTTALVQAVVLKVAKQSHESMVRSLFRRSKEKRSITKSEFEMYVINAIIIVPFSVFHSEAEFLASANHPNIVTLLGICYGPPTSLVFEYCRGNQSSHGRLLPYSPIY